LEQNLENFTAGTTRAAYSSTTNANTTSRIVLYQKAPINEFTHLWVLFDIIACGASRMSLGFA